MREVGEMMNNEEAINFFQNFIQTMTLNGETEVLNNKYCNASRVAISAIEKQIPKKPKRIEYVDGGAEDDCPNCGKRICMVFGNGDTFRWQMPYCCDCGQKLDWEEGAET